MDPYDVLGLPRDADDETIRKRYLEQVRRFSPDAAPEEFQRIRKAYEQIKDEGARRRHELFDHTMPGETPFGAFLAYIRCCEGRRPPSQEELKEYLRKCLKN
ncbi:MAG TPA: J domain-containing protein [Syntrophales bacterium]|jgi:curved DNA-binding protein CbpA|nr:J domain-containing protein [Syntrophales bacterium]HON22997.1 J domain-containing protein [Syntrophales bacterium]HOU78054.1 J domain-containing protein [Syntrophales bacterium]HPC32570.1 J domain-containing protein [Syntrophales bacterium]HQG34060.1 J domain-containing protein [Syntrophales bacterium]